MRYYSLDWAVRIGSIIESAGTTAVDKNRQVVGRKDPSEQARFIFSEIERSLSQDVEMDARDSVDLIQK